MLTVVAALPAARRGRDRPGRRRPGRSRWAGPWSRSRRRGRGGSLRRCRCWSRHCRSSSSPASLVAQAIGNAFGTGEPFTGTLTTRLGDPDPVAAPALLLLGVAGLLGAVVSVLPRPLSTPVQVPAGVLALAASPRSRSTRCPSGPSPARCSCWARRWSRTRCASTAGSAWVSRWPGSASALVGVVVALPSDVLTAVALAALVAMAGVADLARLVRPAGLGRPAAAGRRRRARVGRMRGGRGRRQPARRPGPAAGRPARDRPAAARGRALRGCRRRAGLGGRDHPRRQRLGLARRPPHRRGRPGLGERADPRHPARARLARRRPAGRRDLGAARTTSA